MIDIELLRSMAETYTKYGWQLRALVTTGESGAASLAGFKVPVSVGPADAAWFSRPPQQGPVAWEIRYLGPVQFALVEHLDENSADFEEKKRLTQQRLAEAVAAKPKA